MSETTYPVGRFAPTPSGKMHIGNVAAALISWASIRSAGGTYLLRIEDIDPRGASKAHAKALLDDLAWLGIDFDGEPVWQSERVDLYQEALAELNRQGLVYPCFCRRADLHTAAAPHASDGTPIYAGTCRDLSKDEIVQLSQHKEPALRLRVPGATDSGATIRFHDAVFGDQVENLALECGDFVIQRADGVFAYQLAVIVDDASMGITQVVRGVDLLMSSPRQIYLAKLLGKRAPTYAHIPLLVSPSGRRLSKRDHDVDIASLRAKNVSPEEIIGAIAHAYGFLQKYHPISAQAFVEHFSWEPLRKRAETNRPNIVVDDTFFHNIGC